jgi:hypothetical protein
MKTNRQIDAPLTVTRPEPLLRRRLLLLTSFLLIGTLNARAEESTWTGAQGSNWSEAGNWSNSKVPESGDAVALFSETATEQTVQLDDTVTVTAVRFTGRTPSNYNLGGGTLVFKGSGGSRVGLSDTSGGENSISSDIVFSHQGPEVAIIGLRKSAGTLTLKGKVTVGCETTVDLRDGVALAITGDLIIEPLHLTDSDRFHLSIQPINQSHITISGEGRSSSAPDTKIALLINDTPQSDSGSIRLERPAALSASEIFLGSATSQYDAAVSIGADSAIENTEGTFRVQAKDDGNIVRLNLNGHALDLSNKQLNLFTFGMGGTFVIDMGEGNASLSFAASSNISWKGKLAVINFQAGSHTVRFGDDNSALSPQQLAMITINDEDGVTLDNEGRLVPAGGQ